MDKKIRLFTGPRVFEQDGVFASSLVDPFDQIALSVSNRFP